MLSENQEIETELSESVSTLQLRLTSLKSENTLIPILNPKTPKLPLTPNFQLISKSNSQLLNSKISKNKLKLKILMRKQSLEYLTTQSKILTLTSKDKSLDKEIKLLRHKNLELKILESPKSMRKLNYIS